MKLQTQADLAVAAALIVPSVAAGVASQRKMSSAAVGGVAGASAAATLAILPQLTVVGRVFVALLGERFYEGVAGIGVAVALYTLLIAYLAKRYLSAKYPRVALAAVAVSPAVALYGIYYAVTHNVFMSKVPPPPQQQ